MNQTGTIVSLNASEAKGVGKTPVTSARFLPEHGMEGDAHAGKWHRQVSLLAQESIDTMIAKGLALSPGDFAENITTSGLDLPALPVGTRLAAGQVEFEITQIGKKCHAKCNIFEKVGDCVMPREGIFAKVLTAGTLEPGMAISVIAAPAG